MRMFRCYNPPCSTNPHGVPGFDFTAEIQGECPKCGGTEITPLVPVHLLIVDKAGPIKTPKGRRRIVCRPDIAEIRGRLTGDVAAVTCPQCKASPQARAMVASVALADEYEIPMGTPLIAAEASNGT